MEGGVIMGHQRISIILSSCITVIFLCILLASCGGSSTGSSSGTKTGGGAEETLDVYNFELSNLNSNALEVYYTAYGKSVVMSEGVSGIFTGSYTLKTGAYVINYLSMLTINTTLWDDLSNTLSIQVKEAVKSSGNEFPDEGKILIIDKGANLVTMTLSSTGVSIIHNYDAPLSLSWNDFEKLIGSQAETWKQQAALAWSVMALVTSQVDLAMNSVTTIKDNKDTISQAADHKLTIPCDALSGTGQGIQSLQWRDANGNNILGTGDDFLLTFGNCWENNPKTKVDYLLFGPVQLMNYLEETKTVNNTLILTKTGFSIENDGLTVSETVENPVGTFTIDTSRTRILDGGFTITLSEPTP
jgi:hypothetical protein